MERKNNSCVSVAVSIQFFCLLYLLIAQVCINEPRDHCSLEGRQINWIICLNAAPGYVSSGSAGLEIQLSWASFAW